MEIELYISIKYLNKQKQNKATEYNSNNKLKLR